MKIKDWSVSFFNPFKKHGIDHIIGIQLYKDWTHSYNLDMRTSFEYPHLTICHTYTTKTEYVEKFWIFASKKYREHRGGMSWYRKYVHRQDVNDGRCGAS